MPGYFFYNFINIYFLKYHTLDIVPFHKLFKLSNIFGIFLERLIPILVKYSLNLSAMRFLSLVSLPSIKKIELPDEGFFLLMTHLIVSQVFFIQF